MDENMKQTVEELYALRAGLSLASLEMDKVREIKGKTREKEEEKLIKIRSKKDEIAKNEQDCFAQKRSATEAIKELEKQKEAHQKEIMSLRLMTETYRKAILYSTIAMVVGIVLCIPLIISIILLCVEAEEEFSAVIMFTWPGPIAAIIGMISLLITVSDFKRDKIEIPQKIQELTEKDKRIEEEINKIKDVESRQEYITNLESIEAANNDIENIQKSIKEIQEKAKNEVIVYSKQGEKIYEALVPRFGKILDERDWRNVDLVIFLLETGRAENMKEALQQVDMYRHTEKIVMAVRDASVAICSSMKRGIAHLEGVMRDCAGEISAHLESIQTNQTYLENQLIESNENLSRVINATNMQNALMEKANASSEQLIRDVEQMKAYADEAYYLNRNKWYQ